MLVLLAAGFLAGLIGAAFGNAGAPIFGLVPLAIGSVAFAAGHRSAARPRRATSIAAACVACLAGIAVAPRPITPGRAGVWTLVGEVERPEADGTIVRVLAMGSTPDALTEVEPQRAHLEGLSAAIGARVQLDAELRPHARFRNPSPHPAWPSAAPLTWTGRARIASLELSPPPWWREAIEAARTRVRDGIERTVAAPARGLVLALVLGDEGDVDDVSAAQVRAVGLTHVLAVSGMHVTLVVGALLWLLLRVLRARAIAARVDPVRLAHGIAAPLALVYAAFAGGAPSAWRAAVTAALAWSLRAAGRQPDVIATSALAAIAIGVIDPCAAVRPAFALSIVATAAVLDLPSVTTLEGLALGSLRATIATAPLVWWCFDGVPAVAVLANVLLLPVVGALLLPAATLHALVAALAPALSGPSAVCVEALARGFVGACDALSAVDAGRGLPPPDAVEGIALALTAGALITVRGASARIAWVLACVATLGAAEVRLVHHEQPHGVLRATFLDVGQGDAALLDLPDGSLAVIDTGGAFGRGGDPGARVLVPLLRARRRERVDLLVVTHPHPDHYGGVAALAAAFPIREVWDDGQASAEDPRGAWSTTLRSLGARVLRPELLCGLPRERGGARIEVLWPCPGFDPGWDANDNSLVLRITFGRRVLLLMGDAEAHAEAALVRRGLRGPIDVLKVGHHGSRTSSTERLLSAVRPRIAVVSTGVGNRFGHPHDEVVDRLGAQAEVLRTDLEGGVEVTTDGEHLEAIAWSGARVALP